MAVKKETDYKLPKKLTGAIADRLKDVRDRRLALQKQVDALEAEENAIKEHIIQLLPKSETSGIAGANARVTVVNKIRPQWQEAGEDGVTGWEKLLKHMKKTGDWDLISHALAGAAIKERWDNGKTVPGVTEYQYPFVSLTKP